ncbi:hypothetical protein JCGZ_08883 [Jatropha curcas]|uniref:Nucleoside phosphorylase domain-containing protein n=1 Tax=Jatropha curcas TaxID=180498 RepID=A0A067KWI9_JATCU|nr:hypothetical protein JCGZ_08883 [Jatropha curcas]
MWAIRISVVVFGLLAMAQQSTPLSLRNPVYEINSMALKHIQWALFLLLMMLRMHSLTLESSLLPPLRKLLDIFNVRGIVNYGDAASIYGSVFIGDVSVPNQVAYTAAWSWRNSSTDQVKEFLRDIVAGNMTFEDFNVPKEGNNSLGRIFYWKSTWFTGRQQKTTDPYQPKVKFGLKAGSGDLFIVNKAYGDFLYDTFNISTLDTSDSAIAMTRFSNEIPFIVLRGVSYIVKEDNPRPPCFPLGNSNAVKATAAFLGLLSAKEDSVAQV